MRMSTIGALSLSVALCLSLVWANARPAQADGVQPNLSCITEDPLPDELRRDCEKLVLPPVPPPVVVAPEPPQPPHLIDPSTFRRHDNSSKGGMAEGVQGGGNGGRGGRDSRDRVR